MSKATESTLAETAADETPEAPVEEVPEFATEAAASKATGGKPKYLTIGDTFYAQTDDGELKTPLRLKTKLIRSIRDIEGDETDQFFALLAGIGDAETAAMLDELDFFETAEICERYFAAWSQKNQARLGEAQRSSNS